MGFFHFFSAFWIVFLLQDTPTVKKKLGATSTVEVYLIFFLFKLWRNQTFAVHNSCKQLFIRLVQIALEIINEEIMSVQIYHVLEVRKFHTSFPMILLSLFNSYMVHWLLKQIKEDSLMWGYSCHQHSSILRAHNITRY